MLIAVKVVEHTGEQEGGRADIVEGARESLLAASVSHPNVIPCYKVGGWLLEHPVTDAGPQAVALPVLHAPQAGRTCCAILFVL